jgi:Flp pilus assembly protein TadD
MFNANWSNLKFWSSKEQGQALNDNAMNQFIGKIRIRPGNSDSHLLLAGYYQERGRHREAIDEYSKALSIDPTCVKAYNGKGISYDRLSEYAKAVESYQKALALNPKLDYVLNNLGYSFILQGNYEAAAEAFRKACLINEKDDRIRNNLALAYAMAGHYDQAFREFDKASDGDKIYAHLKLAYIYYEKAMFRQAAEQYRSVLQLNPSLDTAKRGLEATQELLKIEAAAASQKGLEEDITKPISVGALVVVPRDEDKAMDHYQTARKLYEKGSFEEAKHYYYQALALNPSLDGARKGWEAAMALEQITEAPSRTEMSAKTSANEVKKVLSAKPPQYIGIEVCNGNGKRHMARHIATYLKAGGFNIVRLTNARHFNHARGGIYYEKDYLDVAFKIAAKIPQITAMNEITKSDRPTVQVKVLLGKDLIAHIKYCRN